MAEPDAPAARPKSSFMGALIEWLVITLFAFGGGFALAAINPPPPVIDKAAADRTSPGKLAPEKKATEDKAQAAACAPAGPGLLDMPPIVTNIVNPPDTWVRLEASIVFDANATPHPDVLAAEIAADELAYLHTVSVRELQGAIGLENIRQDLRDRAFVRSGGKVTDMLIKTFVLQ